MDIETTARKWPATAGAFILDPPSESKESLLDRILRNPRIPSPPTLALEVFQKSGRDDCTVSEISELLAHDPGLCAKILKTLNSVVYGRSRPVTNVKQAVAMLGSRPLRSLVLGLALPVMQSGFEVEIGLSRFCKKSVAAAVMARELATRCNWPAPDDEMAASLLRDLGMLLLHQAFPERYRPMWTGEGDILAEEQCEWEERCLGVHHADVSAALLERWQLPYEFVESIRFHHHPHLVPWKIDAIVNRAFLLDFVSRLTELEERRKSTLGMEGILQSARQRFGLERVDLEKFLSEVRPKIQAFSKILGVDIGACPNFDELLATGCEELVRVSLIASTITGQVPECAPSEGMMARTFVGGNRIQDRLENDSAFSAGSRIHQYEVIEEIGKGAMGIVLKAFDPGLSRHVAIKLLAPHLARSETAQKRFALEARFAAALRHEHVVAIYAVSELDGTPFLVMEYVHGSSLGDLIDEGRAFSIGEIARIGRQTALGLAAAHEARLIHRDIKPANILLEEGTLHVRVADFGLACAIDEEFHLSQQGLLLGTPNYMSPEQVDGNPLTSAADLFSLGSVLYTMCTGQLPFRAETLSGLLHAVAWKHPTPIQVLNPNIPIGLVRVIEKLHAKDPADRPPCASKVAEWLQHWSVVK